ncbi:unnamed protein product [Lupinus luteus]|uniref:Uncharacterized protein n=1 Tax=Lupinus luteus TaxID=3873 RepID=A0AAV1WKG7_LUPLU
MDPPPGFENGWGPLFVPNSLIYMSISQLVSELRDSFLPTDFDRVEEALVAREAKLIVENEQKRRQIGTLQEKIEFERLRRVKGEIQNEKFGEISVKQEKIKIDDSDVVVVVSELRKRICELESEKEKWVGDSYTIAKLVAENGRLVKEKREAEAMVESWKRKFDALNEQLLNKNGHAAAAGGNNEEKRMMEIGVGSAPLKRNEDGCFSTRKSTSIASKDGPRASAGRRLGIRMDIDTEDSHKKTCESKDKKETNAHPSSIAVQQKNLPSELAEPDETLKIKIPSLHEYGRKINFNLLGQLDDIDSDASSSSSDSSCSLDMISFTASKKKRTE